MPTLGTRHPWLSLRLVSLAMTLDPSIPVNSGILDNVTIKAPEGSILNPRFPAATGVRHATAIRVDNVLVGALAKALPDVMPACSGGIVIPIVFAENDPATGSSHVIVVEPAVGGMGARFGFDGIDGRDSSIANLLTIRSKRSKAMHRCALSSMACARTPAAPAVGAAAMAWQYL